MSNPAEELKQAEEMQGKSALEYPDSHFNPVKNPDVISIIKQEDGNYKAFGQRFGHMIEKRGVKPEDVLVELLTQG